MPLRKHTTSRTPARRRLPLALAICLTPAACVDTTFHNVTGREPLVEGQLVAHVQYDSDVVLEEIERDVIWATEYDTTAHRFDEVIKARRFAQLCDGERAPGDIFSQIETPMTPKAHAAATKYERAAYVRYPWVHAIVSVKPLVLISIQRAAIQSHQQPDDIIYGPIPEGTTIFPDEPRLTRGHFIAERILPASSPVYWWSPDMIVCPRQLTFNEQGITRISTDWGSLVIEKNEDWITVNAERVGRTSQK